MVNLIRLVEDGLASLLIMVCIVTLLRMAERKSDSRHFYVGTILAIGLVPLFAWKVMGFLRRAWVEQVDHPALYKVLHDGGELFESLSGLFLALSVIILVHFIQSDEKADAAALKSREPDRR